MVLKTVIILLIANVDMIDLYYTAIPYMARTGFSLWEILHRENPVFITGMGLQCKMVLQSVFKKVLYVFIKNYN